MITLAILEDQPDILSNFRHLIDSQEDMSCPYGYTTAEDAMTFLPQHPVDILILDIGLPRATGIEALVYLLDKNCVKEFCMFTIYEDDEKIFTSLQAGARGYILKGTAPGKILESIRELYQGGSPMSPMIARRVLERLGRGSSEEAGNDRLPLSPREEEILRLLAKGHLYKEIADSLQLSVGTIKQYLHRTYEKLQVSNRTEAINRLYRK